MSSSSPIIVGVSDVSVGYGSPQIPALMQSLLTRYPSAQAYIIEPDQSERPPRPELFPDLRFIRIPTRFDCFGPSGVIEYARKAAKQLDRLRPDLLMLSSPQVLPALAHSRVRPTVTIYYMLEALSVYAEGLHRWGKVLLRLHHRLARRFNLIIFPEENRAALDIPRGGLEGVPLVVAYNAVNSARSAETVRPPSERRRCLLYSGTIRRGMTYPEYFLRDEMRNVPVDLYGLIQGLDADDLRQALGAAGGGLHYRGYVDAAALDTIRKDYAYSVVSWAPTNEQQRYACPNKFFEAIADGVPPIAAPHLQCKMVIDRYQCGIVMGDWSFEAFHAAVQKALRLFGTPEYERMVENCRKATLQEVNWECQFAKIERHLPETL